MSTFETFTVEEIMEIMFEVGFEVRLETAAENEHELTTIECEIGPLSFICWLLRDEPFFESLTLFSNRGILETPFLFVNEFNTGQRVSRAVCAFEEDGSLSEDDEEGVIISLESNVHFAGGITKEHLRFHLYLWLEDLVDFEQLEFDEDENEDDEELPLVPEIENLEKATLLVLITACLSGDRALTAREIGRMLDMDRQSINPVLYKERERFAKTNDQPPVWSLKN